jgi:hypothetical protein
MMGGFAFSSVILSYFLVGGGTFLTTLVAARLGVQNEYLGYIIMAVGGFLGGFIAARASQHSTIIEPAIGSVVLIASLFGLYFAASSSEGRQILLLPSSVKGVSLTAAASAGGGIAGAFLSEKLLGDSSASSAPWLFYAALAGFGAGVIGTIFGSVIGKGETGPLIGMLALCALLVGISCGASAKSRPLLATLLGGAIGMSAFFYLAIVIMVAIFGSLRRGAEAQSIPSEVYAGIAIIGAGAGIVTMIGAAIGWATVGKKHA